MFNFTTLTILNKVVVATTNQIRNGQATEGYNVIEKVDTENPELRIGNIRFSKADVIDILKKVGTPESLAKAVIDFGDVFTQVTALAGANAVNPEAGVYRIVIYVGLTMNSQDSFYANSYVYKGKPFFVEFKVNVGEDAEAAAAKAAAIAKKYMLLTADKALLKATASDGELTIQATNGYQVLKNVIVLKFDPNAKTIDCCSNMGEFVDIMHGVPLAYKLGNDGKVASIEKTMDADTGELRSLVVTTEFGIHQGLEAFCDYNWIMHNLRLPTDANTNYWSFTTQQGEMPIVGAMYDQFIVRMKKDRDGIAGGVVGQRATSVTTHVFYVLNTLSSSFETAIGAVLPTGTNIKTEAHTALSNPYHQPAGNSGGNGGGGNG